jgi:hypothetical protein
MNAAAAIAIARGATGDVDLRGAMDEALTLLQSRAAFDVLERWRAVAREHAKGPA